MEAVLKEIDVRGYAHPEALVTTEWVQQNLNNTAIRLI